ncbi:MAG: hypothetical protein Q8P50_05240, partial [Bacillota bacterium]|nr:hypothetical protein [Bacillota bacterium]
AERHRAAQRVQQDVSQREHQERLGKKTSVIVDEARDDRYYCRTEFQAPEIDGIVRLDWDGPALVPGDIVDCTLHSLKDHDFVASGTPSI